MRLALLYIGGWVSFGVILGAILFGSPSSQAPREKHRDPTSNTQTDTQDRSAGASVEERTANYTWWLDLWTGGLVAVAFGQAVMFAFQLVYMRKGMEDTKAAANAATSAAKASEGQTKLARSEFIATHRPKIIVRNMHLVGELPDVDDDDASFLARVRFFCMNIGDTIGRIESVQAAIVIKHRVRDIRRDHVLADCTPEEQLDLMVTQFAVAEATAEIDHDRISLIHRGDLKICCIGCVIYKDRRGVSRQMGFAREYNPANGRFEAISDPEYEYSY